MTGASAYRVPESTSPCHRVLTAIRQYMAEHGGSPSYGEISYRARVPRQKVGGYLRRLQDDGYLRYTPHGARSIRLIDVCANISTDQMVLALAGRGWAAIPPRVPALAESYPVDPRVTDWGLPLLDSLRHIE